jgi:hypothetical protein
LEIRLVFSYHNSVKNTRASSHPVKTILMHRIPLLLFALVLLAAGFLLPVPAAAQGFGSAIGAYSPLGQQWRSQQRQLWRPNIHVERGKGESRSLVAGATRSLEFSVKRGFVSRIELRSGQRVIRTLPLNGPAQSGRMTFTIPVGLRNLKLWAWQGQAGYQSVHGESIKYTLNP